MKLGEFRSIIEHNSEPGAVLVFYDKYNSSTHYTDENTRYKCKTDYKKRTLTLAFVPSDAGDYLYRDDFLDLLERLSRYYKYDDDTKCQVMMCDQNGNDPQGYLTDNMWSHMTPDGLNTFAFDNPIPAEDMDRNFFKHYFDVVANGSMLNGN